MPQQILSWYYLFSICPALLHLCHQALRGAANDWRQNQSKREWGLWHYATSTVSPTWSLWTRVFVSLVLEVVTLQKVVEELANLDGIDHLVDASQEISRKDDEGDRVKHALTGPGSEGLLWLCWLLSSCFSLLDWLQFWPPARILAHPKSCKLTCVTL